MTKKEDLSEKDERRIDWDKNNDIIRAKLVTLIKDRQKFPSYALLSKETGLSYITIRRHMKEMKFEPSKNLLRLMGDEVIMNTVELSKTQAAAAKFFFQLMEDWQEKSKFDHTTKGQALERTFDLSKLTLDELKTYHKLSAKLGT